MPTVASNLLSFIFTANLIQYGVSVAWYTKQFPLDDPKYDFSQIRPTLMKTLPPAGGHTSSNNIIATGNGSNFKLTSLSK